MTSSKAGYWQAFRDRIDWWAVWFIGGLFLAAGLENLLAAVMWLVAFISGFASMAIACNRHHDHCTCSKASYSQGGDADE